MNATYPVVSEFVRRGEEILYYATEPFRANILATGAQFASYGDPALFISPAHTGGLHSVMAWEIGLAEQLLPRLIDEIQAAQPDYLLIDSMCPWGNLLQQILDLPAVCMASVFVPNPDRVTVEEMVRITYGQAPKPVLLAGIDAMNTYIETSRRIDHSFGTISPSIVEFFSNRQPLNLVFTARGFHPDGDSFGPEYKFVGPMLNFDRQDAASATDLPLTGDDPLIFISMGTIFNDQPEFFRACIGAYSDAPFRVLISLGSKVDRSALGELPPNIHIREYVPQLTVLQHASLFLTHGGMNSVSEALANAVPLMVLPQHGDQHLVAAQVERAGAGVRLTPADIFPQRLRELAETILRDPRFAAAARAVANEFSQSGGASAAADAVLEHIASAAGAKVSSAR
jgi:MGT family glycosyltransferase